MSHTILVDQLTGHISSLDFRDDQALQAFIAECHRTGIANPVVMFNVSGYVSSEIPGIQFGPLYIHICSRWQDWITDGPASLELRRKIERKVDRERHLARLKAKKCRPFTSYVCKRFQASGYTEDQIQAQAESDCLAGIDVYTSDIESHVANIELALLHAFQNEHIAGVRQFVERYSEEYTDRATKRETARIEKQSIQ